MKRFMIDLAKRAGKLADNNLFDKSIKYKSTKDVVTDIDIKIENMIKKEIEKKYPDHAIISEESDDVSGKSFTWIIDPIDGTMNYSHNLPLYCISIAVVKDKKIIMGAVYSSFYDELFFSKKGEGSFLNEKRIKVSDTSAIEKSMVYYSPSARGGFSKGFLLYNTFTRELERVRSLGTLALEICYVASGRGDGVVRFSSGAKIWDFAAASLILKEAGGKVTDFSGMDINEIKQSDFVGTNSLIHDDIIDVTANFS
ncbi:inositol monophosphatase [Candidatus Woesearchaeota archaeon]|nr:inositol monophosphatase [Candidatus Woesearchaeota archaeon]